MESKPKRPTEVPAPPLVIGSENQETFYSAFSLPGFIAGIMVGVTIVYLWLC